MPKNRVCINSLYNIDNKDEKLSLKTLFNETKTGNYVKRTKKSNFSLNKLKERKIHIEKNLEIIYENILQSCFNKILEYNQLNFDYVVFIIPKITEYKYYDQIKCSLYIEKKLKEKELKVINKYDHIYISWRKILQSIS